MELFHLLFNICKHIYIYFFFKLKFKMISIKTVKNENAVYTNDLNNNHNNNNALIIIIIIH